MEREEIYSGLDILDWISWKDIGDYVNFIFNLIPFVFILSNQSPAVDFRS